MKGTNGLEFLLDLPAAVIEMKRLMVEVRA